MQIIVKGYTNYSIGGMSIENFYSIGIPKKFQGYAGGAQMKKVEKP